MHWSMNCLRKGEGMPHIGNAALGTMRKGWTNSQALVTEVCSKALMLLWRKTLASAQDVSAACVGCIARLLMGKVIWG